MTKQVEFKPSIAQVRSAIARKARELKDHSIPNRENAVLLDQWVQRNFKTEGGLVGGWEPFKRGGRWLSGVGLDTSAKLLQHTGRLRASFQPFWSSEEVGIGSDLDYSEYHNYGTGTIPRRRILPEQDEVMPSMLATYRRYFENQAARRMW